MHRNSSFIGFFGTFNLLIEAINEKSQLTVIKMKRILKFITLLFLCFYTGYAQESLKKHTVSSGETLLSISKKYHITPYDLQKANPGAIDGIKENDVLIIPESKIKTPVLESVSDSIKASVLSSSISHTVKTGDTKFSLAKRYGLTVSQLEAQNPEIISGLEIGQVLEIYPSSTYSTPEIASTPSTPTSRDGKTHRVLKGETLFGISSANGLTVDQLIKANSNTITDNLMEGQILWIPGSNADVSSNNQGSYVVQKGDTKFSLARRFNMSIQELERRNPHIVKMLQVGQTLKVSSDEVSHTNTQVAQSEPSTIQTTTPTVEVKEAEEVITVAEAPIEAPVVEAEKEVEEVTTVVEVPSEKPVQQETEEAPTTVETTPEVVTERPVVIATDVSGSNYITHEVQPNETLFGLAKQAGMSIPEFLELNPQLKESVQIGTSIKMPANATASDVSSNSTETLTVTRNASGYYDLRTSASTSQPKKVLFFLPFSEADYQNYAVNEDNFQNVSDEFKRSHLEFYKGANIAIDSIRKMNLKLDVDVIEAQSANQTAKIKATIQESDVNNYDAVILPFYRTNEEVIAEFTADSNVPVITASAIVNRNNANNLYSAVPSINQQRLKVLNYMKSKQAHIIVLSDVNRAESKDFISAHVPTVDFVEIKKNGSFSENELISKFKKDQLNFVVIDSERNSVYLNTTNALLSQLSNYKLQLAVLDASLIPADSDVSQKRYRILNMVFPSLIPAKSTESSKQFLSTYQKKYNLLPSANIMLGFDITFDSLLRLMQQQNFKNSALNYITEYTQLKFNYKNNILGGYSNDGIYILQYDSDAHIRDAN